MELIRISERKLKIMLTPGDMCHFEFNTDSFGEDSSKMHRAFRKLLAEVRRRTDFEADDKHLSVQYFPSREGGCEMFISHLKGDESEEARAALIPAPKESAQPRALKKQSGSFQKDSAYRFESLDRLLSVCKRLCGLDLISASRAYRDEKGAYFLFLSILSSSPFSLPEELDFIVEYGSIENASILRLYIREHATLISAPCAVRDLAELA